MLPVAIEERLKGYLRAVKRQHEEDLADGFGRVVLLASGRGTTGSLISVAFGARLHEKRHAMAASWPSTQ